MAEFEQAITEIEIYGYTLLVDADEANAMREALIRCEREHGTPHTHLGTARHVSNLLVLEPGDGHQALYSDIQSHMLNMDSPVMMNTVWMLNDFSPKTGGTRVVPGSHKSGLDKPPEGFEVSLEVQPAAPTGSVIVFNGQCWHGGGANGSDHNRHALFGHYRKSMLMFQLESFDDLTPRQRDLMRMTEGPGQLHAADAHAWKGKV